MWLSAQSLIERYWATLDKEQRKNLKLKSTAFLITAFTSLYGLFSSLELPDLIVLFNAHVLPAVKLYATENWLKLLLSVATMLISILLFISSIRTLQQRNNQWIDKKLDIIDPANLLVSKDYKNSGYYIDKLEFANKRNLVIISNMVNNVLRDAVSIPIFPIKTSWRLKAKGQELLPFSILRLKGKSYVFNENKVRLNTDLLINDKQHLPPVNLQKTSYFNSLASNEMSFIQLSIRKATDLKNSATEIYNGLSLFLDPLPDSTYLLQPLSSTTCSNHIGVSTMAITSDQVVIITGQSRHNIQSRRLLAPSGSGSIDWKDVKKHTDLLTLVKNAAERELCEECGINPKNVTMTTKVIGFSRMLNRGGKPEFFCVTQVQQTSAEIEQDHSDQEFIFTSFNHADQLYKKISLESDKVTESVEEFCVKYSDSISVILALNLRFMAEHLSTNKPSMPH
ncbi:hypothetical protein GCM10010919_07750 [Alishewanella longhuensis]|uniref:Nudix hydrolase domain-containing protein n=1 Tax=Alishewanella longhuensis TaxID=1091037 RepID=A0ABQ3KWC9_9ALTE|nr:hypothetical protein [Alishewanella longhuensis]GHG62436.1 hypothetical protein GCM10010919_07750 [Alishewanella longhuensis]